MLKLLLEKIRPAAPGPFFKKLLISYFLMISLLACILFVLSNVLTQMVTQYTNQQIQDNLLLYQSSLEENLDAINSLAQDLSIDPEILEYLNCDGAFSDLQHYNITELIES